MIKTVTGEEVYVTYIHDNNELDKDRIFTNLKTMLDSKPTAAWWGSPKDANYGWKDWCLSNDYDEYYDFENPVYWSLKKGSKIFQIDRNDVNIFENNKLLEYVVFKVGYEGVTKDLPIKDKVKLLEEWSYRNEPVIDFNKMLKDGIVAVELMDSCIGHFFANQVETMFNSWDCESIVVLDSKYIKWRDNETN